MADGLCYFSSNRLPVVRRWKMRRWKMRRWSG